MKKDSLYKPGSVGPIFQWAVTAIYLGPELLLPPCGGISSRKKSPAAYPVKISCRSRRMNEPLTLSNSTLFGLSSRRDCRVSLPALRPDSPGSFDRAPRRMTGRLCGSNLLYTTLSRIAKNGYYPLRCSLKPGLSSLNANALSTAVRENPSQRSMN